jgi:hypothetical protein
MLSLYFSVLVQFLVSLVLQIGVWRITRRPNDVVPGQILWLFVLFLGGAALHYALHPSLPQLVLGWGLACTYIMSFPAASAKSPSLLIIDRLDRSGSLTEADLERALNQSANLVEDRLHDLKADGLIHSSGVEFRPSPVGRTIGYVFWTYRRLLGLPLGEG